MPKILIFFCILALGADFAAALPRHCDANFEAARAQERSIRETTQALSEQRDPKVRAELFTGLLAARPIDEFSVFYQQAAILDAFHFDFALRALALKHLAEKKVSSETEALLQVYQGASTSQVFITLRRRVSRNVRARPVDNEVLNDIAFLARSSDPDERAAATYTLAYIAPFQSNGRLQLVERLGDPDSRVRHIAYRALYRASTSGFILPDESRVYEALIPLLRAKSPMLRGAAAQILGASYRGWSYQRDLVQSLRVETDPRVQMDMLDGLEAMISKVMNSPDPQLAQVFLDPKISLIVREKTLHLYLRSLAYTQNSLQPAFWEPVTAALMDSDLKFRLRARLAYIHAQGYFPQEQNDKRMRVTRTKVSWLDKIKVSSPSNMVRGYWGEPLR